MRFISLLAKIWLTMVVFLLWLNFDFTVFNISSNSFSTKIGVSIIEGFSSRITIGNYSWIWGASSTVSNGCNGSNLGILKSIMLNRIWLLFTILTISSYSGTIYGVWEQLEDVASNSSVLVPWLKLNFDKLNAFILLIFSYYWRWTLP